MSKLRPMMGRCVTIPSRLLSASSSVGTWRPTRHSPLRGVANGFVIRSMAYHHEKRGRCLGNTIFAAVCGGARGGGNGGAESGGGGGGNKSFCGLGGAIALIVPGAAAAILLGSRSAHCEEAVGQDIKLITYNVLAPRLSRHSHYPKNKKEDCDPANRFDKIMKRMEAATADATVIALQEVDLLWAGKLHAFFAEKDYCVVFGQYGNAFSGYMGVMVAWPRQKYEAVDVEISRLADTAPQGTWPKNQVNNIPRLGTLSREEVKSIIGGTVPEMFPAYDEWATARQRSNEAIFVKLRPRASPESCFVVSTYHMPCLFGSAEKVRTVNIHSYLLVNRLRQFANGDPAVLLGDFNFKPDGSSYRLVAGGGDLEAAKDFPSEIYGLKDRLPQGGESKSLKLLESAHRAFHGREPVFTNYCQSDGQPEPFCATLDYIWFTPERFVVMSCPSLPGSTDDVDGLFPSTTEPSDHLPIFATLRLR
eukprot:TRINITY_DN11306_c0_g1_i1.p1 TRINITY_DN11306_c0_g1~~TRINITY_DN11306_c0_g1_i1.p1  ORF type:complete len:477 (+),score=68.94 TRINITY_DN11306_c0_g1_i1:75-1505(+)